MLGVGVFRYELSFTTYEFEHKLSVVEHSLAS